MYLNVYFYFFALVSKQRAALSSATQQAFNAFIIRRKVGMKCLNTRFPLPTSLCAEHSVKRYIYVVSNISKDKDGCKMNIVTFYFYFYILYRSVINILGSLLYSIPKFNLVRELGCMPVERQSWRSVRTF